MLSSSVVAQYVPEADAAFVDILSRLPDPPPESREQLLKLLPELHRQFLEKRRAFQDDDDAAWQAVMMDQERLVTSLDRF